jgi:hypothetical protein
MEWRNDRKRAEAASGRQWAAFRGRRRVAVGRPRAQTGKQAGRLGGSNARHGAPRGRGAGQLTGVITDMRQRGRVTGDDSANAEERARQRTLGVVASAWWLPNHRPLG